MTTENKTTPVNARDLILSKLVELPAKEALDHPALMTLLALDELKPAITAVGMMIAASKSSEEARKQARFEQERAEATRANAHQAEMDALSLDERKLDLEAKRERIAQDKLNREERQELLAGDRAARRANGSHS
jgi:hypothetical protein